MLLVQMQMCHLLFAAVTSHSRGPASPVRPLIYAALRLPSRPKACRDHFALLCLPCAAYCCCCSFLLCSSLIKAAFVAVYLPTYAAVVTLKTVPNVQLSLLGLT